MPYRHLTYYFGTYTYVYGLAFIFLTVSTQRMSETPT